MLKRLCVLVLALSLSSVPAKAVTFGFENVTNNNALDVAIGEAQLQLDVTDNGSGVVRFLFANSGPAASSITDIYFDQRATILGGMGIIDSDQGTGGDPGVDFSKGASPPNLPGGNLLSPAFVATRGLSADSDPPVQRNGVNPGEFLVLLFNLRNGSDFDDVIAALNSGVVRVGIHVQGFASGGSESYVQGPAVPEPSAALLSCVAIGSVGCTLRDRRRR